MLRTRHYKHYFGYEQLKIIEMLIIVLKVCFIQFQSLTRI